MNVALYGTVWIALACFVFAEFGKRRAERMTSGIISAVGITCLLAHIAMAFDVRHHWSHESAVRETARQTADVYGMAWGGGVYVNYLFALTWAVDAWRWFSGPPDASRRSGLTWALRAFYFTIIFNAAVVFAAGPRRWLGVVLVLALLWAWLVRRADRTSVRQGGP